MNQIATNNPQAPWGLDTERVWSTELAYEHLKAIGQVDTKRTAERRLNVLSNYCLTS